jgi:hypothetical protein
VTTDPQYLERLARQAERSGDADDARRLTLRPYSEVEVEDTRWAWRNRIPLGALTLLAGRQGLGKSTLLTSLAADLSCGRLPGDLHGEPAIVLMASFEDSPSTVAARLLAADADRDRVVELGLTEAGQPDLLTLPADAGLIAEAVREHGARAVIVDPVMAALSGRVDSYRDQDVRRALAPFAQLAADADLAVIGVLHLRKGVAAEALDRISGSVAFTAAARSVLAFGQDPGAADNSPERVLAHAKSNLGPLAPSLSYRVEPVTVEAGGSEIQTVRLASNGECNLTASDLLAATVATDRSEVEIAAEWLADELAEGEWRESRVIKVAAKGVGISERTLQRAKQRLGVEDRREGYPAVSEWRLPVAPGKDGAASAGAAGATCSSGVIKPESEEARSQSRQGVDPGATGGTDAPCRYASHRPTDYLGAGGKRICGICHPSEGA